MSQTQAQYITALKEDWFCWVHPVKESVWEAHPDAVVDYIQAAQQIEVYVDGLGYLPVKKSDILPLMKEAGRSARYNLFMTMKDGKRRLRIDYAGRAKV